MSGPLTSRHCWYHHAQTSPAFSSSCQPPYRDTSGQVLWTYASRLDSIKSSLSCSSEHCVPCQALWQKVSSLRQRPSVCRSSAANSADGSATVQDSGKLPPPQLSELSILASRPSLPMIHADVPEREQLAQRPWRCTAAYTFDRQTGSGSCVSAKSGLRTASGPSVARLLTVYLGLMLVKGSNKGRTLAVRRRISCVQPCPTCRVCLSSLWFWRLLPAADFQQSEHSRPSPPGNQASPRTYSSYLWHRSGALAWLPVQHVHPGPTFSSSTQMPLSCRFYGGLLAGSILRWVCTLLIVLSCLRCLQRCTSHASWPCQ